VLHDAEDVLSEMELRLFNYLVDRKDLIQLPVYPFERRWYDFTSGHYIDEFAEVHGKDILVREAIAGPGAERRRRHVLQPPRGDGAPRRRRRHRLRRAEPDRGLRHRLPSPAQGLSEIFVRMRSQGRRRARRAALSRGPAVHDERHLRARVLPEHAADGDRRRRADHRHRLPGFQHAPLDPTSDSTLPLARSQGRPRQLRQLHGDVLCCRAWRLGYEKFVAVTTTMAAARRGAVVPPAAVDEPAADDQPDLQRMYFVGSYYGLEGCCRRRGCSGAT
jgi:hypothetical protein